MSLTTQKPLLITSTKPINWQCLKKIDLVLYTTKKIYIYMYCRSFFPQRLLNSPRLSFNSKDTKGNHQSIILGFFLFMQWQLYTALHFKVPCKPLTLLVMNWKNQLFACKLQLNEWCHLNLCKCTKMTQSTVHILNKI